MFRFTTRDMLWLMVVAGLGVGWWLDHRDRGELSKQLVSESRRAERFKTDYVLLLKTLDDQQRAESMKIMRNQKYLSDGK